VRILIVGVGKIGSTITAYLSHENHDITIIDTNSNIIQETVNSYDVSGIIGNGASSEILFEAGAKKADLLIASTSSDEVNILSCLVAKKFGVKYTIARVRNPEYSKQIDFIHKELDINMIVNPELETAKEISRILRFPSALRIETFGNGRVEIAEMMIVKNSPLIGKSLVELREDLNVNFLICIVDRDGKAYIPDGNFILEKYDKIYVNAASHELTKFFKKAGNLKTKVRSIMIIGGGIISFYLAKILIDSGVKVKIIELDKKRCQHLSELLPEVEIICGEGSDQTLLIEEGIKNVESLITLTGLDEENIIISLFAKTIPVPKIITKINRYNLISILKSINLDSIITPKEVTAYHMIRYVRSLGNALESEVKTLYKLVNNQVEAQEFYIAETTKFTGIKFKDLKIKKDVLVASIIRKNKVIIPSGQDYMGLGDSVIIVTTNKYIHDLEDILE
jgi:trk system potassium uptake protein TrkA